MAYLFSSESVSEGHPDKVSDQISDALLDQFLAYDDQARCAIETFVTTGQVIIMGEVRSKAYIDLQTIARETIKKIHYTMLGDPTGQLSRGFGVYKEDEGVAYRGTFLVNPEGLIKLAEIQDNSIGRNADELVRKVEAAQFVAEHDGEVCPARWKKGDKTLKPGIDLVGKI